MPNDKKPVVWVIWDGAPYWAVRKLLAENALPNLKAVVNLGVFAAAAPPELNCQTPPSLANLFTGVNPQTHGICGFNVPDASVDVEVTRMDSGFKPDALKAKTIWEHAADAGKKYVLVSVPWVRHTMGCQFALEGYLHRVARRGAVELSCVLTMQNGFLRLGPFSLEIARREGGVEVAAPETQQQLRLDEEALPFENWRKHFLAFGDGLGVYLWLCKRQSDEELVLIYSGLWRTYIRGESQRDSLVAQIGPFNGEGHGSVYRNGILGPRLEDGGDGSAEALLVQTINQEAAYFERASQQAVQSHPDADLYIFYQPGTDDIGHELMGLCDPQSKAFNREKLAENWHAIQEVYRAADQHLGTLLAMFQHQCTVIVSSDHGMAGITHTIYVNEVFNQAGLLEFDPQGNIDLAKTRVLYHPANNGSVWINEANRPDGIVNPEEVGELLERTKLVLANLVHEESGQKVIQQILEPEPHLNIGALFLEVEDGYEFSAGRSVKGTPIEKSAKSANHSTNPQRPSLQGVFAMKSDNLNREASLAGFDNKNVFPIICHQLRIAAPKTLEGTIPVGLLA